jgi:glutaminyl-peptide cyclotransferase
MRFYSLLLLAFIAFGCTDSASTSGGVNKSATPTPSSATLPIYGYEVVNVFPHDRSAFTQGLVVIDNILYESTGNYGSSSLRKIDLTTGKILRRHDLAKDYFAEGITIFNNKIYQLTWKEKTAFVYDMDFKLEREFTYAGEGWGLTHDGTNLLMSDGTHIIRVVEPSTFNTLRTIAVQHSNGKPLMRLNELEYINGEIWANIWHSEDPSVLGRANFIARIDPASGKVKSWIDLGGISPEDQKRDSEATLNGIAYDVATERIFVTGKRWSKLFEIKLTEPKQQ